MSSRLFGRSLEKNLQDLFHTKILSDEPFHVRKRVFVRDGTSTICKLVPISDIFYFSQHIVLYPVSSMTAARLLGRYQTLKKFVLGGTLPYCPQFWSKENVSSAKYRTERNILCWFFSWDVVRKGTAVIPCTICELEPRLVKTFPADSRSDLFLWLKHMQHNSVYQYYTTHYLP